MKNVSTGNTAPADQTDWQRVRSTGRENVPPDADNPQTTENDWEDAIVRKAGVEVGRVRRGPQKSPTKVLVSIRYSPDVLDRFRASGDGWQARMDAALRDWLEHHKPEDIAR
ncbi:MAG: BrnA antitoxin family protein [Rhodocyclaceae bacterium]